MVWEASCAFVNLDKYMATCYLAALGEMFFVRCVYTGQLLERLMRYHFAPSMLSKFLPQKPTDRSSLGTLYILPTEILRMIFEELDELNDAICFGLANSILLHIGAHHINAHFEEADSAYSWRGDRIMLLADSVPDAPKDLLTAEDIKKLDTWGFDEIWGEMGEDESHRPAYMIEPDKHYRTMRKFDQVLYWTILWHQLRQETPVLMNLSKRVYVVEKTIQDIAGPFNISLQSVMHARICWAFEESWHYPNGEPPVKRGAWAGDRFAVEDKSYDRCVKDGEEWTDVSHKIGKELLAYWKDHSDRFESRPSLREDSWQEQGHAWLLKKYRPRACKGKGKGKGKPRASIEQTVQVL
ncbi:hypothetical protein HGRIS_003943 [Hohenbuehelia grisea]|uniref:F-box domain-containing protein n=1 Tax=Hohenbuehelia grisea TaxID=104357 RepID=A0ABR3JH05_9AGAR